MSPQLVPITKILATLTLLGHIGIFVGLVYLVSRTAGLITKEWRIVRQSPRFYFATALFVALGGTLASLFYSEIAGFAPCGLCWLQRIFLYPQVILLGMALYYQEWQIAKYSIALSSLGGLVALYHSYIQFGGSPLVPCPLVATAVSCSQRFVFEFGYITFPVMSLTAFALIILLMIFAQRVKVENK